MNASLEASKVLELTITVASIGVAITTLEFLSDEHSFRSGGIYDWSLLKYRYPFAIGKHPLARTLDLLLRFPNVLVVLASRACAAIVLVAAVGEPHWRIAAVLVVYITNVLILHVWSIYRRGSDGMTSLIFGVALLVAIGRNSELVVHVGVWFIALQSLLSYCGNGLTKIGAPDWRAGTAVLDIFRDRTYGSPGAVLLLENRPIVSKMLSWSMVVMDIAFPIVLLSGWVGCAVFLAWGVLFHAASVVLLGLNSFFWAYVATYPAIVWASLQVQSLL